MSTIDDNFHEVTDHDAPSTWEAREAQLALEDAQLEARLDAARAWEVLDPFGGCPTCSRSDDCLNVYSAHFYVCHTHHVTGEAVQKLMPKSRCTNVVIPTSYRRTWSSSWEMTRFFANPVHDPRREGGETDHGFQLLWQGYLPTSI